MIQLPNVGWKDVIWTARGEPLLHQFLRRQLQHQTGRAQLATALHFSFKLSQLSIRAAPYPNATQRDTLTSLEMGMEGESECTCTLHAYIDGYQMRGGGRLFYRWWVITLAKLA